MADSKSALIVALDNEQKAREASEKAAATVHAKKAARDGLIADAAAGKPLTAQNIRAAEEETRSAEIDSEIAAQVHAAATWRRHEAQVAVWHDEAIEIRALIDGKALLVVEADDAVKAIETMHREAVAERDRKLADYAAAFRTGGVFNTNAGLRNANPVLAALDSGDERPRVYGVPVLLPPEFSERLKQPEPSLDQARQDVAKAKANVASNNQVKA